MNYQNFFAFFLKKSAFFWFLQHFYQFFSRFLWFFVSQSPLWLSKIGVTFQGSNFRFPKKACKSTAKNWTTKIFEAKNAKNKILISWVCNWLDRAVTLRLTVGRPSGDRRVTVGWPSGMDSLTEISFGWVLDGVWGNFGRRNEEKWGGEDGKTGMEKQGLKAYWE